MSHAIPSSSIHPLRTVLRLRPVSVSLHSGSSVTQTESGQPAGERKSQGLQHETRGAHISPARSLRCLCFAAAADVGARLCFRGCDKMVVRKRPRETSQGDLAKVVGRTGETDITSTEKADKCVLV